MACSTRKRPFWRRVCPRSVVIIVLQLMLGVACRDPQPAQVPAQLETAVADLPSKTVAGIGGDVVYTFDSPVAGTQGWTRAWGEGFDNQVQSPVRFSTELSTPTNAGALRIDVDYRGDGREAVIDVALPPDLESFEGVDCDVFLDASLPNQDTTPWDEAFNIGFALDDDWRELGFITPFSFDTPPTETLNGKPYYRLTKRLNFDSHLEQLNASARFVIRLAGKGFLYHGPLFVDNIVFRRSKQPAILPQTFAQYDVISGDKRMGVRILRREGTRLRRVTMHTPAGQELLMQSPDGEHFEALWQTLTEREGPSQVVVRVHTEDGQTVERRFELRIWNSGWTLGIVEPVFDQTLRGKARVVARIGGTGGAVQAVTGSVGKLSFPLVRDPVTGDYQGMLETTSLPDGTQTVVVTAKKGAVLEQSFVDVMVENGAPSSIVRRAGPEFVLDGKPFRYLGWNNFNLPFLYDRTLKTTEMKLIRTADGQQLTQLVPRGAVLSFREQVDREMLEARRVGLRVLRTWGYRTDGLDTGDWFTRVSDGGKAIEFNEAQYRKFDIIMDSARRHDIKVVIVLQNYWADFGGIKVTMEQLGSASRNRFFTDPTAKALFRQTIAHFAGRRNSVNGALYRDDPALFAWELMNEPRMDGTYEREFWDRDGRMLGAWLKEMSAYVHSLDPNHLIASGAEGHPFQGWGLPNEGFGTDPFPVMDQQHIDYFTIHFYPNRQQFRMTQPFATELLSAFVKTGHRRGKPVVLEEWGFETLYPVRNAQGIEVFPEDPAYPAERLHWHRLILSTFAGVSGNGSHLWGFQTSAQDKAFGINVYSPPAWVERDVPFVTMLMEEAQRLQNGHRVPR